jgi:hypothetical protein
MNTHYVTFILRLQLNSSGTQGMIRGIFGSLQQAGLQKIRYFDSPEKFQEALQELLPEVTISSENTIRSTEEETRS